MADEEIHIRAELDGALERDTKGAARAVDDLGEEAVETAAQIRIMEAAAQGASRELKSLKTDTDDLGKSTKTTRTETEKVKKSTDESTSALDRMQKVLHKFKGGIGALMGAAKIPVLLTGLKLLAGAASSLGAGAVAAVAGLAPLTTLIAAYPALATAGLQAMGTFKLATKGLGDAIGALVKGDFTAADTAMAGMTDGARGMSREVAAFVKGPFANLQKAVQGPMMPGLRSGFANAVPVVMSLKRELKDTSWIFGRLANEAGEAMNTPMFKAQLGRIMDTNNAFLWDAGHAAGSLGSALLDVVDAFRPVTEAMGDAARKGAAYVAAAADAGNKTGRMSDFFQRAWNLAKDVGTVIGDLAEGLFNVASASQDVSKWMGTGIADLVRQFKDWSGSMSGQSAIKKWFADAQPTLEATAGIISDIAKFLGNLAISNDVAPLLNQIRNELLPTFEDMMSGVTGKFGPALIDAANAFMKFQSAIAYGPIADIIQAIANAANAILDVFLLLPGPIKALVGWIFALNTIVGLGATAGTKMLGAFRPMGSVLSGLKQPAGAAADKMGALEKAGFGVRNAFRDIHTSGLFGSAQLISGVGDDAKKAGSKIGYMKGAFRGMGQVGARAFNGIKSAGAGLVGALGGPWMIAIMAATVLVGRFMQKHAESKARVDELTDSLDEQTGALTDNSREIVLKQLADSGALEAADKLGVSMGTVTSAALGNKNAIREVNAAVEANDMGAWDMPFMFNDTAKAAAKMRDGVKTSGDEIAKAKDKHNLLAQANRSLGHTTRTATNNMTAAAAAEDKLAGGATRSSTKLRGQTEKTNDLIRKTLELKQAFIDSERGNIGFQQQLDDTTKELRKGAKTLDIHTQAGRDNRSALLDLADAAAAVKNEAKRQEALKQARTQLVQWGKAAGWSETKAKNWADKIIKLRVEGNKLPSNPSMNVEVNGVDSAQERLNDLRANVENLTARSYTMDVRLSGPGGETRFFRHGGPVAKDQRGTVGEVGPELLLTPGRTPQVIGRHGRETRTFDRPGVVLPNEVYKAAQRGAGAATIETTAPPATHARTPARGPEPAMPDVHIHFHGDRAPSQREARRAGKAAFDEFSKNYRERHIGWADA